MGLWVRLCPCVCGADWPGQLLRWCLLKVGLKSFVTQLETPELHQRRLGNLVVRTHTPQQQQPETQANAALHVSKWSNCIRTTQYTWWSFLPLNFWSQFTQPANFYFFAMAVLQMIPAISDSDGMPTFLFPLGLVMLITAAKDAYENIKRAQADRAENRRKCTLCTPEGVQQVQWDSLRPGDIVKLHADEAVPADVVLLNCSDPYGVAYVETMQLDGETNLKNKTCLPPVAMRVMNDEDAANIHCKNSSRDIQQRSNISPLRCFSLLYGVGVSPCRPMRLSRALCRLLCICIYIFRFQLPVCRCLCQDRPADSGCCICLFPASCVLLQWRRTTKSRQRSCTNSLALCCCCPLRSPRGSLPLGHRRPRGGTRR